MDTKASQVVTQLREVIDQNHSATCDALFRTACESMTILEPWLHATSKNPVAMNVIEAVQKIIPDFVDSLKGSIDVAKQGFKISGDMIYLCDHLLDLDGTRHQEVEEYVSELKSSATEAETGSKQVATTFREVRRRLLMITDDIPGQVARIEEDRQRQVKKNENSLKHIEKAKFVKACCTGIAAIAGGVTLITCPPALIILPIALPLICLMTEAFETRALKKITERETREQDCREAQKTLEKVTMDLVQLAECVDRFASFWRTLELLLETVSGRVRELRKSRSFRLRLKNIKSSLEEIARSFEEYSVKVGHLCEFMALKAESTGTRKLDRIEERATRSQKSERMIKT